MADNKNEIKKNKVPKKQKMPKLFKEQFKSKYFEKKIMKKLYLPKDKEFVQSLYEKKSDGTYVRKMAEITNKDDAKKIKGLAVAIKKNRSFVVDTTKLGLVLFILAAVIVFYLVFRNMLVKIGIEAGLESIFNAKANVEGVNLDLVGMKISFKHLDVADEGSPMKNLFELGKTEIAMNSEQLLMGKIVVQNVECENIRWNTDRNSWGGLKPMGSQVNGGNSSSSNQSKAGEDKKNGAFDLKNIDVNKVINENKTNLKSLTQISNANRQLASMNTKWQGNVDAAKKNVADSSKNMEEVRKIDVNSIKTPDQAKAAYDTINRAYPSVNNLIGDMNKMSKDIGSDKTAMDKQISEMNGMVDRDYKYLLSAVQLPKGGVMGIASSIADKYLQEKFGKLYYYAMKAKSYTALVQGGSGKKDNKNKKQKAPDPDLKRRAGYTVPFPTQVYPAFLLQNLSSSFGKKSETYFIDVYLKDVASDPNLWGKPITFHVGQDDQSKEIILNGISDGRTNAKTAFGLELQANNYPFEIKEGLSFLNANWVKGKYQFKTSMQLDKNNATAGTATIRLTGVDMDLVNKDDLISKVILDSVKSVPAVTIEVNYQVAPGGALTMNMKSNLDGIIGKKLNKILGDMISKYQKEIKDGLMKQVEPELKKNQTLYSAFNKVNEVSKGNLTDANAYKAELDKKKKEIDDQLNKATKEAQDKVKQEANKQIKNLPKIPGF